MPAPIFVVRFILFEVKFSSPFEKMTPLVLSFSKISLSIWTFPIATISFLLFKLLDFISNLFLENTVLLFTISFEFINIFSLDWIWLLFVNFWFWLIDIFPTDKIFPSFVRFLTFKSLLPELVISPELLRLWFTIFVSLPERIFPLFVNVLLLISKVSFATNLFVLFILSEFICVFLSATISPAFSIFLEFISILFLAWISAIFFKFPSIFKSLFVKINLLFSISPLIVTSLFATISPLFKSFLFSILILFSEINFSLISISVEDILISPLACVSFKYTLPLEDITTSPFVAYIGAWVFTPTPSSFTTIFILPA